MAFLRWLIALPLIVIIVYFAFSNPQIVTLTWSPFHQKIETALYIIALTFFTIGIFIGIITSWFTTGGVRKERRHLKKQYKILEKELNKITKKDSEVAKQLQSNSDVSRSIRTSL